MVSNVKLSDASEGYRQGVKFELTNGQVWEQTSTRYMYRYSYRPEAVLDASGWTGKIKIDGCDDEWVDVRRTS
jgi:hypothetical protein